MSPQAKSFVIYTQPNCKWCVLAKDLLNTIGWFWTEIDITQDEQAKQRLKDLQLTKVPQIWIGDEHIGGYSNLEAWWQARKGAA